MEQSIKLMKDRIVSILSDNNPSVFLFGSVVLGDFKLGWSDIDIICLVDKAIQDKQANELVNLRQTLKAEHEKNPYFRLFEGGMLTLDAFLHNAEDTVVYWGTSGQRITNRYELCPFSKIELIGNGRRLCGNDFRHLVSLPQRAEIVEAIRNHYETIRQHGKSGGGWLLDIARCLYTLRTNKIIAKTKAGEWAIGENLCPDTSVMRRVLEIRNNPLKLKNSKEVKRWEDTLGLHIQNFADVLEKEMYLA
ncbi:MAG: DUF4111 domain-containing protein [Defluviitaleaceae bacterium]|nr:DUF4111 domain-containing protein [Defluviitaleaceae bacterium]